MGGILTACPTYSVPLWSAGSPSGRPYGASLESIAFHG